MSGDVEGVAFVALGGALIGGMASIVRKGTMRDRRNVIDRATQPRTFWSMIVYFGLLGAFLLGLGIRDLAAR